MRYSGSRRIFLTGHNLFLLKITSLRVVICPLVYTKDHASVRCYSQCLRASSLTSSKVIFLGHTYADDTQLYLSFKPDTTSSQSNAVDAMERCISAIRCWMIKEKLKVNDSKTEFILIGARQQLAKVDIKGLVVGDATVSPVTAVKTSDRGLMKT